jgi:SPP1 gp7 family putative phage head morphogenesis protein
MPNVLERAAEFRKALLDRDSAEAQYLARAYQPAIGRIDGELNRLISKIERAQAVGEDIKPSWLFQADRLQVLLDLIEQEVDTFAQTTAARVTDQQAASAYIGRQDAQFLIAALEPTAASNFIGFNTGAIQTTAGFFYDGSPLSAITDAYSKDTTRVVRDIFVAGLAIGKNPREIARQVSKATAIPLERALTIARTESLRAYRIEQINSYQNNADVVKGWQWSADLSTRTCVVCIAMHGTIHPLDEPFASHVSCRCAALPVTTRKAITESGEQWFARQSAEDQQVILETKTGYRAYREGKLNLSDLVEKTENETWGPGRNQRGVQNALARRHGEDFARTFMNGP